MLMSRGVEYTAGLAAETGANAEQRRRCRITLDSDQVERKGGFTSRRSYDSSRRFHLRVAALHCSPQLRDLSDGR